MNKEDLKEKIIQIADESKVTNNNLVYVNIPINKEDEAGTVWNTMLLATEYKRGNKEGLVLKGERNYQIFMHKKESGYMTIILLRV